MANVSTFDIPLILSILRPDDDWGPHANTNDTYDDLKKYWRGKNPCPTLEEMKAVVVPPQVPQEVATYRIQAVLDAPPYNLLSKIAAEINALKAKRPLLWFAWNRANTLMRNDPNVIAIGKQFGLSDKDIDNIFILAASAVV
jgi:hypothetical protein